VLTLSANGGTAGTGIVWSSMPLSQDGDHGTVQGVLRAFDANDLRTELWNSRMNASRDDIGLWPKFSPPTVANGKVYMASFSNVLNVYGLLPSTPDFTIAVSPGSQSIAVGGSTTYTVSAGILNGFAGSVSFTASGLPAGATATFNPTSVTGSGSSTLTVQTSSSTPTGSSALTITGTSGSLSHSTSATLVVIPPDFTISGSPSTQTVIAGGSTSYTATVTAVGGFTGTVSLGVSGLPTGATASFNPTSVTASGSSTLSVSTVASALPGNYTLTVTGTSGSLMHSTTVSFVISALPAGWTDVDIGSPGMVGSANYSAGTFTVNGGGADIWYSSDQFNYLYQSLAGDLTITARVASQQNTDGWAKAGVMVRETPAANASYVSVLLTPANGLVMQYRSTTGSNAVQQAQVAALAAPNWVRLVRSGSTFTGYRSADGITWTQVGSISLTMASSATAGMTVTAHNNSLLNTSSFGNVSITAP